MLRHVADAVNECGDGAGTSVRLPRWSNVGQHHRMRQLVHTPGKLLPACCAMVGAASTAGGAAGQHVCPVCLAQ
jgi:hypothetical protein